MSVKKILGTICMLSAMLSPMLWAYDVEKSKNNDGNHVLNEFGNNANLIYTVSGSEQGILSVIDARLNQVIKTMPICPYPNQPVSRGGFLYVAGSCFCSLIIDTAQNHKIIKKINERMLGEPILNNNMIYFFTESSIRVMDIDDEHNTVMEKSVVRIYTQPILHNNLLYTATNWRDLDAFSLQIYDTNNFLEQIKTIVVKGRLMDKLYADDQFIYIDSYGGKKLAFDTLNNYEKKEIE